MTEQEKCAFCGATSSTKDHIPPTGFFPKPKPSNLITVPSCKSCNSTFGKNDEYIQAIIGLRDDITKHPEGSKLAKKVIRGLGRPKAKGFRSSILRSMQEVELKSGAGLYLGRHIVQNLDKERFTNFVEHLVRGLFFDVFKQPVPNDFIVSFAPFLEWQTNRLADFVGFIKAGNVREIGGGIFRYGWAEAPDSPLTSIWYMEFFGIVPFGAIVRDSNSPKTK